MQLIRFAGTSADRYGVLKIHLKSLLLIGCLSGSSLLAETDPNGLMGLSQSQLDTLYEQSEAGPMPEGYSRGEVMFFPGSDWESPIADILRLVWQGKIFDVEDDLVYNEVFGIEGIIGKLSYGPSLLDGNKSIRISYRRSTVFFRYMFDELRELSPQVYLGRAYVHEWGKRYRFFCNFALWFH
jgi:hypothetical protein